MFYGSHAYWPFSDEANKLTTKEKIKEAAGMILLFVFVIVLWIVVCA